MTKRILTLFFSLMVILNIVGCGGSDQNSSTETTDSIQLTPEEAQKEIDAINAANQQ